MDNGQWIMDNGQWTMDNGQCGQWTMDNGQWTMDNGQWTMDNGQWTMWTCIIIHTFYTFPNFHIPKFPHSLIFTFSTCQIGTFPQYGKKIDVNQYNFHLKKTSKQ
jgi:hypothetical protein